MARPREFDPDVAVDAALEAFREKGYEATSLTDLLEATGLARQSLYNTFGDKRSLYLACLRRFADVGVGRLSQALASGSVRDGFRAVFEASIAAPEEELRRGCLVLSSAAEVAPRDGDVAQLAASTLARQERIFADALRRGAREGELALTPRRVEQLARFLMGALQGIRMVAKADPSSPALADMVKVAMQQLDDASVRGPVLDR